MICTQKDINLYLQGAQQAKGFSKDDKLRAWGLYQVGKRHANDAIRHATYWLLFGYKSPQNGVIVRKDKTVPQMQEGKTGNGVPEQSPQS
jgi:hypothetical protein